MKKLSITLAIALAAFAGVAGATGSSADAPASATPCCKGIN
jgi:hypothetical protein